MAISTNIRTQLVLLVVLFIIPIFAILFYNFWNVSEERIKEKQVSLQLQAEATAAGIDQAIRSAASLLYTFSKVPQLRKLNNRAPCGVLARLLTLDSRYSSGYIILPDGLVHCISGPANVRRNVSDRAYFRRAMASGKVEVGLPTLCRNTDQFCFPMALALRDVSGQVTSLLALDLDPIWLSKRIATSWSEPQTSMIWWDHEARVAFAWPRPEDWFGKFFTNSKVSTNILAQSSGQFSAKGIDGIDKLFGFSLIRGVGYPDLKLSLSIPRDIVLASAYIDLKRNLVLLIVLTLFLLGITWMFGKLWNRRQLSESRFKKMFNEAPLGIALINSLTGHIYSMNSMFCKIAGRTSEQMKNIDWMSITHPDDVQKDLDNMALLNSGEISEFQLEKRYIRSNGSISWINLTVAPICVEEKADPLHLCMVEDINERKQAELRIEQLTRLYTVLSCINSAIVRVKDENELYSEICRITTVRGKFSSAYVGFWDEETKKITIMSGAGAIRKGAQFQMPDETTDSTSLMLAKTIKNRIVTWDNHLATQPDDKFGRGGFVSIDTRAAAFLPFTINDTLHAVMLLYSDTPNIFGEDEVKLLRELAGDVSFALDHIDKTRRVDYIATHDQLTGLPNRTLFLDRLMQTTTLAKNKGELLAVVLFDIKRFNYINDTFGRQAGDMLLRKIADLFQKNVENSASLARIGPDIFAVIYTNFEHATEVAKFADSLREKVIADDFIVYEQAIHISVQAGIALFPSDGLDAETLFSNSEAALKRAKSQHGDITTFYTPNLNAKVAERLSLESRLHKALKRDEFILHYQPKVDLSTGHIIGLEALIRWQDPVNGLISPMHFIPILEDTGLIIPVGYWVMQEAMHMSTALREKNILPLPIAVNVSPEQLRENDFVPSVEKIISTTDKQHSFDIEITESVIMHNIDKNVKKLNELCKMGIELSIDDFGTGFSSLAYIARLPIEVIKIDCTFIQNLNSNDNLEIVKAIISLAHSMKLKVVAEGVETKKQAQQLRFLRCDQCQGYLFSKPVPADEIARMLSSSSSISPKQITH